MDGHFEDIIYFLTIGTALKGYSVQRKKELVVHVVDFSVIVGHIYKMGIDEILWRYVPDLNEEAPLQMLMGVLREDIMQGEQPRRIF